MLRVTTLYAESAAATAAYYAHYLTMDPGEAPGVWCGSQADGLGLAGTVTTGDLELLLSGRDPMSGTRLGSELVDRYGKYGKVIRAVSGYDATFSAPKSLSVWWALTGDPRLLEAHDAAVTAALGHLERFGSTTRRRQDGQLLFPDTGGLTMATFRQTTSRADDPQLHTHVVVSTKVQTADGRWYALDGRYVKQHQRMLGGLYQSVLRAELTSRFGVGWRPVVNGQAEIAGIPPELLDVFSKRTNQIDTALHAKVDEFRQREGRLPSRFERAAMEREAAKDTRRGKSGNGVAELATRWRAEAGAVGWTADLVLEAINDAGREAAMRPVDGLTIGELVDAVSTKHSSWCRADVVRALCDVLPTVSHISGRRCHDLIETTADQVVSGCIDLDPPGASLRRTSDGRSVWIEPTAPRYTSEAVLTQEESIITWAMAAQATEPSPSTTMPRHGLDDWQGDAAASVAGHDGLVLVVGPAGAGKTRMLAAAVVDLSGHGRAVFGLAPTAKAARVLEADTGMRSDTVAKLLHEWRRPDRPPGTEYRLAVGTTVVVDEAAMMSTPDLYELVRLTETNRWRLVLVGDHRQLQAVGRGGLFSELCANGRVEELERLHRFTHRWEAAASLRLRSGDPSALDGYQAHGRIIAGTLDDHLERMAQAWMDGERRSDRVALVASTNDHVDAINRHVQAARLAHYEIDPHWQTAIAGGEVAHGGDVVVTRRNDRRLLTTTGQPVRNRQTWTVDQVQRDGSLTVTQRHGHGTVTLPSDYVCAHVRLGYAATEHGHQSDTVACGIALASHQTTRRGLYVAATRGRDHNELCVITDSDDVTEARDVLDTVLAHDRADIPAVTQRRTLAAQDHRTRAPRSDEPVRRCPIPNWFPALLDVARDDRDQADRRLAERQTHRDERLADIRSAQARLRVVDEHTRRDRAELADASSRVAQARRRRDAAARVLNTCGLRGRRRARRALAVADDRLDQTTASLKTVEHRVSPAVATYNAANDAVRQATDAARGHELISQLGRPHDHAIDLHSRVAALETWRRWADGDPVNLDALAAAVQTLNDPKLRTVSNGYSMLGEAITHWASDTGLERQVVQARVATMSHAGLELSL